jgi:hypothetical protein
MLAASGLGAIKAMRPEVTLDPWRDFTWVSLITNYQLVLVVHPALPAKTLKEWGGSRWAFSSSRARFRISEAASCARSASAARFACRSCLKSRLLPKAVWHASLSAVFITSVRLDPLGPEFVRGTH